MASLFEGINVSIIAMGIFGVGEILRNLEEHQARPIIQKHIGRLWPSGEEIKRAIGSVLRGTTLGSLLGVLPGSGTLLAPFASYVPEKKLST